MSFLHEQVGVHGQEGVLLMEVGGVTYDVEMTNVGVLVQIL